MGSVSFWTPTKICCLRGFWREPEDQVSTTIKLSHRNFYYHSGYKQSLSGSVLTGKAASILLACHVELPSSGPTVYDRKLDSLYLGETLGSERSKVLSFISRSSLLYPPSLFKQSSDPSTTTSWKTWASYLLSLSSFSHLKNKVNTTCLEGLL